jgi:hypothetical protein
VGVYSGWGGKPNGLGGLYKTANRGQSWKRISDLDRVGSCTVNPGSAAQAYVTTETSGLWSSSNINTNQPTFTRVDTYPFGHPSRVFFNPYSPSEIWITSFGNGMRKSSMNAATTMKIPSYKTRSCFTTRYFGGILTVETNDKLQDNTDLSILSIDGKIRFKQTICHAKNSTAIQANIGSLSPGIYIVVVNGFPGNKISIIR